MIMLAYIRSNRNNPEQHLSSYVVRDWQHRQHGPHVAMASHITASRLACQLLGDGKGDFHGLLVVQSRINNRAIVRIQIVLG